MGIRTGHQRRGFHDLHGGDVLHAQLIEGVDGVARPGGGNQDAGVVEELILGLEGFEEGGVGDDGGGPGFGGPDAVVAAAGGEVGAGG